MNRIQILICTIAVIAMVQNAFAEKDDEGTADLQSRVAESNSAICGPLCVRHALRLYGTQPEIVDLVRETQWPDLEYGASMQSLAGALNKRDVFTLAVVTDPGAVLLWHHPIIVHLSSTDDHKAHFVVALPPFDGGSIKIWDPLTEPASGTWQSYRSRMSGAILLTSNKPISGPPPLLQGNFVNRFAVVSAAILSLSLAVIVLWPSAQTRKRHRISPSHNTLLSEEPQCQP